MKEMSNLPKEGAHPTPKTARVAGAWYLLLVVTSVSALTVSGNATSTAGNIRLVLELASNIVFVFLVRALYGLLKGVNKALALLMVTFVLVSASISFLDELNQIAALFNQVQLDGVTKTSNGFLFGFWLFPFGVLVYRSHFIPRIFGILLIANGFAYPATTLATLLSLSYRNLVSLVVILPMFLGELSILVWLLVKGVKVQSLNPPAPPSASPRM